ncbi:MAG: hypothetical protein GY835_27680 [bacterium]|nr:hypothetical protein [bacterium]
MRKILLVSALLALLFVLPSCGVDEIDYDNLAEGQKLNGFVLRNLYEDSAGNVMGARLVNEKNGFLVDMLQIQSVPQGFMWVKSIPWSDMGEAHACEHLLLGKGREGRLVANLEDMTLGDSSAWTAQLNTVYHFNTLAGEEAFYTTLEARINALLNPNFTDEEIRREVCHIGATENPTDGSLFLEEKGTVYTEMVSAFEGAGYPSWFTLLEMLYGADHPEANSAGGFPDAMRAMVPKDMWTFHKDYYRPANMGLIASLPKEMPIGDFLTRLNAILDRCWEGEDSTENEGMYAVSLPEPAPAYPAGAIKLVPFQSESHDQRGSFSFGWPATLKLDFMELITMEIFMETFSSGPGSQLYDAFINSETRRINIGITGVNGYQDDKQGNPLFFDFSGVLSEHVTEEQVVAVRDLLVAEFEAFRNLPDGSEEMKDFNRRATSAITAHSKQMQEALNTPPMFGFRRGSAGYWQNLLGQIEQGEGFRRSLVLAEYAERLKALLDTDKNIWRTRIDKWRLASVLPVAVAVYPSPELMTSMTEAKDARLAGYLADFKAKYGKQDDQEAMAAYKAEFDATTAELNALAAGDEIPGFIDSPPMTNDDQLEYEVLDLEHGVDLVASTFDNMNSTTLGLALRLDVLPEKYLHIVPFLPTLLTAIGVEKDGEVIDYIAMNERVGSEVTRYASYFSTNSDADRVELVLRGTAAGEEELAAMLSWMKASLTAPLINEDNLTCMRDIISQNLAGIRRRMSGRPEYWVQDPAAAWRHQDQPLILAAGSFLTQGHYYQRLGWLLSEPGSAAESTALVALLNDLAAAGSGLDRAGLTALLDETQVAEACGDLGAQVVSALRLCLPECPDGDLAADWSYLCGQIKADLLTPPATTLAAMRECLELIRNTSIARAFLISSTNDRAIAMPGIRDLVTVLSTDPVKRMTYASAEHVYDRMRARESLTQRPHYYGLINNATRNGVLVFRARNKGIYEATDDSVLDALAGKLYSGGGSHGLFMRTWAAGLAYSNGYGYNTSTGSTSYYAERCPDIAQTMRFVVGVLQDAEVDDSLLEYAIAGAFSARSGGPYGNRGEAMANDLTDGIGPERVRAYREKVLEMRKRDDLLEQLKVRMPHSYGQVLIGYGPSLADSKDGNFMVIGPEEQFTLLEDYIASVETPQRIPRIYPRDYWFVR